MHEGGKWKIVSVINVAFCCHQITIRHSGSLNDKVAITTISRPHFLTNGYSCIGNLR